jgi:hypothetical protein
MRANKKQAGPRFVALARTSQYSTLQEHQASLLQQWGNVACMRAGQQRQASSGSGRSLTVDRVAFNASTYKTGGTTQGVLRECDLVTLAIDSATDVESRATTYSQQVGWLTCRLPAPNTGPGRSHTAGNASSDTASRGSKNDAINAAGRRHFPYRRVAALGDAVVLVDEAAAHTFVQV